MKAANCPRKIDPNLRLKNIVILKKKIKNKKILNQLLSLEEDYQLSLYNLKK